MRHGSMQVDVVFGAIRRSPTAFAHDPQMDASPNALACAHSQNSRNRCGRQSKSAAAAAALLSSSAVLAPPSARAGSSSMQRGCRVVRGWQSASLLLTLFSGPV
ncbi:hypothetical protein MRX96_006534 [Rhipicephalus microplus]